MIIKKTNKTNKQNKTNKTNKQNKQNKTKQPKIVPNFSKTAWKKMEEGSPPPTTLNERRNILIFTVHKLCIRIGTISR